jgi:peptidoglycan/LPS O-acetylase OafA/YrhL
MPTSMPRTASHLPILDGLRGIAVLLVLWAHVSPFTPGYPQWLLRLRFYHDPGIQGVDLFFVLSGFLITRILLAEREQGRPVRWFLLRRVLRIFPIYYLLLAIVWFARGGADVPWCAVYLSNFHFAFGGGVTSLTHTWSLCVEEHFYLLWPPIVAFGGPFVARRAIWWGFVPLALATIVWFLWLAPSPHSELALRYTSPVRFLSLAAGCLLAFHEPGLQARPRLHRWLGLGLILLGALVSNALLVALPMELGAEPLLTPQYFQVSYLASALSVSTGLLLCCVCAAERGLLRLLAAAPLRAIGRISYGLYLYHLPLFQWLGEPATVGNQALAVAAAFAAATASYWVIERPILRFGARLR